MIEYDGIMFGSVRELWEYRQMEKESGEKERMVPLARLLNVPFKPEDPRPLIPTLWKEDPREETKIEEGPVNSEMGWSTDDKALVESYYREFATPSGKIQRGKLSELARRLGRTDAAVQGKARKMGLTKGVKRGWY